MRKYSMKAFIFVMAVVMAVVFFACCGSTASVSGSASAQESSGIYTVQFDLNFDSATDTIDAQTVEAGGLATEPAEPVRTDYVFEGWYTDAEGTTAFDFTAGTINVDTTLYAKWSEEAYYIAGNFTGYDAKMAGYSMKKVEGMDGWYWITVELTADVRDMAYDGHYYKITDGTWDEDGCWGTENYALQPAPESPTGGGLGSIYVYENCTLTVYFDSVNKAIYDDSMMRKYTTPRIYGDFNTAMGRGPDWSTSDGEALELADADRDGIYTGLYEIPAYTGESEGYSMVVALSEKYYFSDYGNSWGVNEQYLFDGHAAGMGSVSYLKPEEDTVYEFEYDSSTHVTMVTEK